ncbi:endonuclease/exonuclease/phosphatase family protein [Rhizobiaceae bacterium BDR2-2]|uniref:Endonuclease/exonuclease/phosphatase family protein n=1 Tax=Ectorhizobium quercum TaxID=2965071 RepID=A0AAE3MWI7_9HYPH|nr:endonuclease/exonuclease/phosphatase family protein [Ectorhizobium quercum]MCX8996588.1 endonuclease/exonuclease/phosphatase family protein [Ectorhizobium quercum]
MRQSISCLSGSLAILLLGLIATRYVFAMPYLAPFYNAQVHLSALATGLAILSFVFYHKWYMAMVILGGIAMTAHLPVRSHALGDMATAQQAAGKPSLRVLSFNVLAENLENGPAIADEILGSNADVAIVLEARQLASQFARMASAYPYRLGCGLETTGCDLVVLSRHPFVEHTVGNLSDLRSERYMHAVIEKDGERINVAAAHLSKPYFDDYHTVELWRLWRRMARMEGPIVLAGDFNAASIAPDMMWFLRSAGLRKAPYEPATWPTPLGPLGIAIDHIYARAPMRLTALDRIADNHGSNHFGLIADLVIEPGSLPRQ